MNRTEHDKRTAFNMLGTLADLLCTFTSMNVSVYPDDDQLSMYVRTIKGLMIDLNALHPFRQTYLGPGPANCTSLDIGEEVEITEQIDAINGIANVLAMNGWFSEACDVLATIEDCYDTMTENITEDCIEEISAAIQTCIHDGLICSYVDGAFNIIVSSEELQNMIDNDELIVSECNGMRCVWRAGGVEDVQDEEPEGYADRMHLHINDHGNMTMFARPSEDGVREELWSVV